MVGHGEAVLESVSQWQFSFQVELVGQRSKAATINQCKAEGEGKRESRSARTACADTWGFRAWKGGR
jgi:predicted Zn-dependent protease